MLQLIPLTSLQLSPLNARKTGGDNVDDLMASIAADGLLQNLTVVAGKKGKYEVVAGGRRLRAMQALAKARRIRDDVQVPCRLVDAETAIEASTAENTIREQMNPADEIDAYGRLADVGKSPLEIATRFGQSERHVNGMLRLGSVAPALLADLRKGEIRLDQVKAFAVTDDHDLQVKVWKEVKGSEWNDAPEDIREQLTERDIEADSQLARYITVQAYEEAGGAVRRDLFGDGVYLLDRLLVDRLALDKLERRAATERKKGWAWVECRVDLPYSATQRLQRLYNPTDDDKAFAGVFVTIGHDGKARVEGPFVRPGDRQRAEHGQEIPATEAAAKVAEKAPPKDGLSAAQLLRLKGVRTAIAQGHLVKQQRFMLAALAASLASREIGDGVLGDGAVKVRRVPGPAYPDFAAGLEEQGARDASGADAEAHHWHAVVRDMASAGELQQWLLDQPEQTTLNLLSYLAAQAIILDGSTEDDEGFLQLAGIDMAAAWQPTAEWLGALGKATILRIVRAVLGEAEAEGLAGLKKGEIAQRAAHLLKDTGYLPEPLRPAGFDAPWAAEAP